MGVRIGNSVGEARKKCRDLIVREPDVDLYRRAQEAIGEIVSDFSPLVEPARSGRHYLDLTGTSRLFGPPRSVAEMIRRKIIEGLTLPADAGLAANKLVSRVASFDAAQKELVEVPSGDEKSYLSPHQVEILPSVIRETRVKLFDLNIRVVEQVNTLSSDLLLAAVGPPAYLLQRQSQGIDPSPVTPPGLDPRISLAQELPEDSNNRDVIELVIHSLALDGVLQLAAKGCDASEMALMLTYGDRKREVRSMKLPPHKRSGDSLLKTAIDLFLRIQLRRVRIRRVEIDFRSLTPHIEQGSLMEGLFCQRENLASRQIIGNHKAVPSVSDRSLIDAIGLIRTRFGSASLAWGV